MEAHSGKETACWRIPMDTNRKQKLIYTSCWPICVFTDYTTQWTIHNINTHSSHHARCTRPTMHSLLIPVHSSHHALIPPCTYPTVHSLLIPVHSSHCTHPTMHSALITPCTMHSSHRALITPCTMHSSHRALIPPCTFTATPWWQSKLTVASFQVTYINQNLNYLFCNDLVPHRSMAPPVQQGSLWEVGDYRKKTLGPLSQRQDQTPLPTDFVEKGWLWKEVPNRTHSR